MNTSTSQQWLMQTKIGPLYLVASAKGLRGIFWQAQAAVPYAKSLKEKTPSVQILAVAVEQVSEYLNGARKAYDLPLDFSGTDFQQRVWKALQTIPYGKTISYRALAAKVKSPNAFRAVGSANGRNPLSLVIPCHRVIAANGTLGGYAGGLEIKKTLLNLEAGKI